MAKTRRLSTMGRLEKKAHLLNYVKDKNQQDVTVHLHRANRHALHATKIGRTFVLHSDGSLSNRRAAAPFLPSPSAVRGTGGLHWENGKLVPKKRVTDALKKARKQA